MCYIKRPRENRKEKKLCNIFKAISSMVKKLNMESFYVTNNQEGYELTSDCFLYNLCLNCFNIN